MDRQMSVKEAARRQYARIIDGSAEKIGGLKLPSEGWLTSMRKALGMSAPQLARRAGVTKAAIYQAERKELEGGVTIRQMEKLADSLAGRFVYAIVPNEGNVSACVRAQARAIAARIIRRASSHMALEKQSLPDHQVVREIEQLADKLAHEMPRDFWDEA